MPISEAYSGKIDHIQILDKDGNVDEELEPRIPDKELKEMYKQMKLQRVWDNKNMALQRTGRIYTYAPCEGQEAIQIGAMFAIDRKDWVFPTYRETFLYSLRDIPLWKINLSWRGMEEGLAIDPEYRMWPAAIPIGTQLPYAVGTAYKLKLNNENAKVLVFGGDGSTSEGEFHDALNFAGVLDVPVIFLISNNGWAISTPRKLQTASKTIAQKALAYGLNGLQIDGNDILAVYYAVKRAKTPQLIEALTYRMGPHTTADDPKRYRNEEEVRYWKDRDPIKRFRKYLEKKALWNETWENEIDVEINELIENTVKKQEEVIPNPKDIFKYQYEKMTKNLEMQMKECFGD